MADRDGDLALAVGEAVELLAGVALAVDALARRSTWPISRRVIVGESIGSPAATARTARTISAGGVSLSRNPPAPARSARRT